MAARGFLTVPALLAAVVEPEIGALYLAGGIVSFASIVETENYSQPFSNFAPNLLLHTDLPQLAGSIAPQRVALGGLVNGAGQRLSPEQVHKKYGEAAHIHVTADAVWDAAGILGALSNV